MITKKYTRFYNIYYVLVCYIFPNKINPNWNDYLYKTSIVLYAIHKYFSIPKRFILKMNLLFFFTYIYHNIQCKKLLAHFPVRIPQKAVDLMQTNPAYKGNKKSWDIPYAWPILLCLVADYYQYILILFEQSTRKKVFVFN